MRWLLLLLVPLLGCRASKERALLASVAAATEAAVTTQRGDWGPYRREAARLDALGGRLHLEFVPPADDKGAEDLAHVHLRASVEGGAPMEACLMGTNATDLAETFADSVLPPLASLALAETATAARRFYGDSLHGVPKQVGWVGTAYWRGAPPSPELEAHGYFTGADLRVPHDGRPRLVKVVIALHADKWKRTIEVDGEPLEVNRVLPIPSGDFALHVQFAVLEGVADPVDDEAARARAVRAVGRAPEWLPAGDRCASEVLPSAFRLANFETDGARGGRLPAALERCRSGAAGACYEAALELQRTTETSTLSTPLFLRACALGDASGCTNAAANTFDEACGVKVFSATCERGDDPWGCTMLAMQLVRGKETPHDVPRARAALRRACRFGEEDPACRAAHEIEAMIDADAR